MNDPNIITVLEEIMRIMKINTLVLGWGLVAIMAAMYWGKD